MTTKEIETLKLVYEKGDTDSPLYFSKKSDFGKALKEAIETLERIPRGHGRLIDADAIQKYQIDTFGQRLLVIDTAPTIIEADREG